MIWNDMRTKLPHAFKTGMFDGKKSEKLLVCDAYGKFYIAEMYMGFLDGSDFRDFYDLNGFEIKKVEYWIELETPFSYSNQAVS